MNYQYLLIFAPLIISFSISAYFTTKSSFMKKDEPKPFWQPPSYMFSLIWSILYLLTGFVLYYSFINKKLSKVALQWIIILSIIQVVLENSWVIYTSYLTESDFNQLLIMWLLLIIILSKIIFLSYVGESNSALLSSFEIIWLSIAISLLSFNLKKC